MYALFRNGILIDKAENENQLWTIADIMGITLYGKSATHIVGLEHGYVIKEIGNRT